ncbi:hypothetical protein L596_017843 [Steinernema carpocapsae]|uniref:CS domain-containing protein n=1 Tax=Steinernema carpocapsae TaxID=34508 RepID=A0A4V6A1W0_STECR|nr:hypothetical protein L596_017843 [Steinernema carpocapsae]
MSLHPQILWAQRESILFLTVGVEDLTVEDLSFNGKTFHVKGTSGAKKYESTLELFDELKPESVRKIASVRQLELVVEKVKPEWWPRLTAVSGKLPWVKVDFNKWRDEDENELENPDPMNAGQFDLSSLMGGMGGMPGMEGLSGLGGDGAVPSFDDDELDYNSEEDDDEMPPLEPTGEASTPEGAKP